jgi:uncharacterized protein YecE (DUF72 family)
MVWPSLCVDAPEVSRLARLFAVTNPDLLVVRLHGRSDSTWAGTSRSAAERFRYLYSDDELEELARPIAEVAHGGAREPRLDEQLLPRLRGGQHRAITRTHHVTSRIRACAQAQGMRAGDEYGCGVLRG